MTGSGCLQGHLSASSWPFITRPPLWSLHAAAAAAATRTLCPERNHLNPFVPNIHQFFARVEIDTCVMLHSLWKPSFFFFCVIRFRVVQGQSSETEKAIAFVSAARRKQCTEMEMLSPTLSGEQSNLRTDVEDKSSEKNIRHGAKREMHH